MAQGAECRLRVTRSGASERSAERPQSKRKAGVPKDREPSQAAVAAQDDLLFLLHQIDEDLEQFVFRGEFPGATWTVIDQQKVHES